MKKRNKIIAGLIVGGAIGSVLGMGMWRERNKRKEELNTNNQPDNTPISTSNDIVKPKRRGVILKLLDWLEKK